MKKLLIATMAAVSVGLCAKAEDTGVISETSFEGLTTGGDFEIDNDYWQTQGDTEDQFKITNVTYSADATNQHWDWTDGETALSIDTANPILRNVNPKDGETGENTAQDVSTTPVFFDSVVQFTATDVAPSMENNTTDKLAVWLYTSPDDVSDTNLGLFGETSPITRVAITAGYLEDGATVKVRNYLTNIEVDPNTWHRLTIKSFVKSGRPWYSVWVDKTPVNGKAAIDAEEELTEFLSMVSDEVNTDTYTKLQGVAFDGKGAVDDIVFMTTEPGFMKEPEAEMANVKITINNLAAIADVENGGIVFTAGDDEHNICDTATNFVLTVGTTATLQFMLNEGFELESPDISADGDGVYTITIDSLTAEGATIAIVTKEVGGSGGVTVDGTPVEFDNDGMIANITTAFDGKAVSGELDTTKFKSYYTAKVENGILSIKLDQKAAAPFAEATEEKEVLEVGEDASGNPVLTVRIKPYVGLYYGAMTGSALDNLTLTAAGYQEATTDEVIEFTATGKAGDTAGFIKVVVTDIAPESTEE